MDQDLGILEKRAQGLWTSHVAIGQLGFTAQGTCVGDGANEGPDCVTIVEQAGHKATTDETGRTGDCNEAHAFLLTADSSGGPPRHRREASPSVCTEVPRGRGHSASRRGPEPP